MEDKPNENFDEAPKNPSAEEVFAGGLNLSPSADDIFAGGKDIETALNGNSPFGVIPDHSVTYQVQGPAGAAGGSKKVNLTHILLGLLTIAVLGLTFRPAPKAVVAFPPEYFSPQNPLDPNHDDQSQKPAESSKAGQNDNREIAAAEKRPDVTPGKKPEEDFYFNTSLSWNLAHSLFNDKDYRKAHYVYEKLAENLRSDDIYSDMRKDILSLQMALCLYFQGRSENLSRLLTAALDSRSPAVRALGNYYLALIDFRAKRFLSARTRAYCALATLEIIKEKFPDKIEADCYFLMANALTCEVNRLNNSDSRFPGKNWSDTYTPYFLPEMNASELTALLNMGVKKLDSAVLEPIVHDRKGITVGSKYSAIANKSSIDEVIAKFASLSGDEIIWSNDSLQYKNHPVTMLMTKTSGQEIPEIALGSLGLIARFDGSVINVHNFELESSLESQKKLLTSEAASAWLRFLLRYRKDPRRANAHFSIALMREYSEMYNEALGEYKIILSRYPSDSLAPFALLNSSKIKTNLSDYYGAQKCLEQLVLEYPDARIVDEAYLHLAEANLSIKMYSESFNLFKKVYHVNLTKTAKAQAAYGAAVSKFYLEDFESAEKWFERYFSVVTDTPNINIYKAYYFLAKTKFNLGKYSEAVAAYKYSLSGDLAKEEFCKIVIEITETLIEKGEIAEAANLIENLTGISLPQKEQTEIVIAKARIYNAMNLPGKGITLLKQEIDYMADYQLRSMLMLELGRSYIAADEYKLAYKELAAAITEMPVGEYLLVANKELAEVCMKLKKYQQAVELCLGVLNSPNTKDIRYQTCRILGKAYKELDKYEKAAEAFAGIYDKYEVTKNE